MTVSTVELRRQAVKAILDEEPELPERAIASRLGCSQASVHRAVASLRSESQVVQRDSGPDAGPVRSVEAQAIIAALNAELAANGQAAGEVLEWSAAEQDVIAMIGAEVDRRVELSAAYESCDNTNTKLKIATELRLLEGSISRLYRQVATDVPGPMSITSQKASRAAHSRWSRQRLAEGQGA